MIDLPEVPKKVRILFWALDYHDIEDIKFPQKEYKTMEVGFSEQKGLYLGVIYTGRFPSHKEIAGFYEILRDVAPKP